MAAIDAGVLTKWRTNEYQYIPRLYLYAPSTIYTWRVNRADFAYPMKEIDVDGGSGTLADVKVGMTVLFGTTAGARDLGWTYIREAPDSTLLKFGRSPRGKRRGEIDLQDNAYVTVLNLHEVWVRQPYIAADGTQYRDDLDFAQTTAWKPVAVAGVDVIDYGSGGALSVDVDGSNSYVTAPGASIASYAWDFGDGTPSTSSNASETVSFPTGARYIYLTVTDDQSPAQSHTTSRLVVVLDPASTPLAVADATQRQTLGGQTLTFKLEDAAAIATYPTGTRVGWIEREFYNSTEGGQYGPTGRTNLKFTGWLDTEDAQIKAIAAGLVQDTTLTARDVGARLARLKPVRMTLNRQNTSPAAWNESEHASLDRFMHHYLQWLTTALGVADGTLSGTGSSNNFHTCDGDGSNMADTLNNLAKKIGYRFVTDERGRMAVRKWPLEWDSRTSTVICDLNETDYSEVKPGAYDPETKVSLLRISGVIVSTASADETDLLPMKRSSVAPAGGKRGSTGQAGGTSDVSGLLFGSQNEADERSGHMYAEINSSYGDMTIQLAHPGDVGIDPALIEWVRPQISSGTAAQRGETLSTTRFLVMDKTTKHTFAQNGASKTITLTLKRETTGSDGEAEDPPEVSVPETPDPPGDTIIPPIQTPGNPGNPYTPQPNIVIPPYPVRFILPNSDGYLYRAPYIGTNSEWEQLSITISGTMDHAIIDLGSSQYKHVLLQTTTSIYRLSTLTGTPTVTLLHTFPSAGDATLGRISQGRANPNFIVSKRAVGGGAVKICYSSNRGSTWSADIEVVASGAAAFADSGLYVSDHLRSPSVAYLAESKAAGSSVDGKKFTIAGGLADITRPFLDSEGGAFGLHLPFHNNSTDQKAYFCLLDTGNVTRLYRVSGSSQTNISPVESSTPYGVQFPNSIATCPRDGRRLVIAGRKGASGSSDVTKVWASANYGTDWIEAADTEGVSGGAGYFTGVAYTDDPLMWITYGYGGILRLTYDAGVSTVNCAGNIPTDYPSAGRFLNIFRIPV